MTPLQAAETAASTPSSSLKTFPELISPAVVVRKAPSTTAQAALIASLSSDRWLINSGIVDKEHTVRRTAGKSRMSFVINGITGVFLWASGRHCSA